jgi:23S rRNA pseudouridine1911/1915/1917 synthase
VREQEGVAWSKAKALCEQGRVAVDGVRALDPAMRVPAAAVVTVDAFAPKLRAGPLPDEAIVHFDRDVVVVDKPPGLLSVADDEEGEDTLAQHVRTRLRRLDRGGTDAKLGVVHRLDKDTSGLMVFARNATAQRALAAAFRAHDIERVYHALAHGAVAAATLESDLVLDRGDGLRGSWGVFRRASGPAPREARHAVTYVKPLQALRGATLVECRLETGRQHQIRIHLAEAGHPLLGERVYIRDYAGAVIAAPRAMLHARRLGFAHPRGARPMSFEREPPEDFRAALAARA